MPIVWVNIYRSRSIIEMVVLFTPCHSVALGIAGVLIFGEVFTTKLVIGAVLSMAAVWVMN
jgi:drug/metabolite transporter (DMT)-like permease